MMEVPSRRVLLPTAGLGPGGLERQLTLLATHLPARWRPVVLSLDGGPFVDGLRRSDVAAADREAARPLRPPAVCGSLSFLIATERPDVVHAWHWMPDAAAAPVCRLLEFPWLMGRFAWDGRATSVVTRGEE